MSWLAHATTLPTGYVLGVIAWAVVASICAVDRWWQCRRRHCTHACGGFVAWDEQPPEATPDQTAATRQAS